jgi:hypothetical protein
VSRKRWCLLNKVTAMNTFEKQWATLKKLGTMIVTIAALAGCSTPARFESVQWQEKVLLINADVVTVQRATVPGNVWYSTNRNAFYREEQTIRFPDGTIWDSRVHNPTRVFPILIDRDERSWILIASPQMYGDHLRMGCPVPNYVYLRASGSKWVRVRPQDVPDRLQLNLLIPHRLNPFPPASMFSVEDKKAINAKWLVAEKEEHKRIFGARANPRYSWMEPLSHLVTFSKYCDPSISECEQVAHQDCDPKQLLVKR